MCSGAVEGACLYEDAGKSAGCESGGGDGGECCAMKRATGVEHALSTKVVAWWLLVCVQLFSSTVLKLANTGGEYAFSPQSSLVLSESLKVALSVGYLVHSHTSVREAQAAFRGETCSALVLHMLGLAAIYCGNNGLMFWLFARADPGSIALIKSGATLVSAALLYLVRRFRLSATRWAVLALQMVGLVVAQWDSCRGRAHLGGRVYALLVVSLLNSSVANVWNEWVIKRYSDASLATKNVWLYLFGAALNMVVFLTGRGDGPAFWQGYGALACLVVISNAFMGVAMNAVYKYADAVVKNLATTTTTVILLVISAVWFAGRSDLMVFLGAAVVMLGTLLYFRIGALEDGISQVEQTRLRGHVGSFGGGAGDGQGKHMHGTRGVTVRSFLC